MRTYTEEEFKKEYERGVHNGKAETLRDLTVILNNGCGKSYEMAFNMVTSFYTLAVNKLTSNLK